MHCAVVLALCLCAAVSPVNEQHLSLNMPCVHRWLASGCPWMCALPSSWWLQVSTLSPQHQETGCPIQRCQEYKCSITFAMTAPDLALIRAELALCSTPASLLQLQP